MSSANDNQSSKKKRMAAKAALVAAAGAVALSSEANAAEGQSQFVSLSSLDNVSGARRLPDGSLEVTLENGEVVRLAPESFVDNGGELFLTPEAAAQFADENGNLLLVGLGFAAVAAGVAIGASGGGDDDDDAPVDLNVATPGDDVLTGTANDDTISGLEGNDVIDGFAGNDVLSGNAGADTLRGGDGDDVLAGGGGTDVLDGGAGNDTNSFQGIGLGVTADLAAGTASYGAVNETFTNFENLLGSDNDDTLAGDAEVNTLSGAAGDDLFIASASNDIIDGGTGIDTVDYSDSAVPVVVSLDANGNGTATREVGFSVEVTDAAVTDEAVFIQAAEDGNLYFNIHTEEFGGGEIRGQLSVTSDSTVNGIRTIVLDGDLDSSQEPDNTSDSEATGTGQVTITVAPDGSATYSSTLDVSGIAPSELTPVAIFSAIHLHNAPAGTNGGVVQDVIQDAGGDVDGNSGFTASVDMVAAADSTAFIASADAGNLYFNVHTADFPGGEIRGQLDTVVSDTTTGGVRTLVLSASLDSAQEPNGASDSPATGEATVTIVVDTNGNASYSSDLAIEGINVDDLITLGNGALSAIHLHDAPAGVNGGVLQDFIVDAGGTTTDFSVLSETDVIAEVTEVDTLISIENVIGQGDSLIAAGPSLPGFSVEVADAAVADEAVFIQAAEAGNLYFNIHTEEFGGGEIRGQLSVTSDSTVNGVRTIVLDGDLDSSQEPDNTSDSDATGTGQVTITVAADGSATYSSTLDVSGISTADLTPVAIFSAIHLHNAPAGTNGGVVQDLIQDAGADVDGLALSAAVDTGDGNVFTEFVQAAGSSASTISASADAPVFQSLEVESGVIFSNDTAVSASSEGFGIEADLGFDESAEDAPAEIADMFEVA